MDRPLQDLFKQPTEIEVLADRGLQSRVQPSLATKGSFCVCDGNDKENVRLK